MKPINLYVRKLDDDEIVSTIKVTNPTGPRVEQVIEKQLGRMHPTPNPRWNSYIFPDTVEPDDPKLIINLDYARRAGLVADLRVIARTVLLQASQRDGVAA